MVGIWDPFSECKTPCKPQIIPKSPCSALWTVPSRLEFPKFLSSVSLGLLRSTIASMCRDTSKSETQTQVRQVVWMLYHLSLFSERWGWKKHANLSLPSCGTPRGAPQSWEFRVGKLAVARKWNQNSIPDVRKGKSNRKITRLAKPKYFWTINY